MTAPGRLYSFGILPKSRLWRKLHAEQMAVFGNFNKFLGKQREKGLDLGATHGIRMPKSMESDERPYPIDISFLGAYAVVQIADALAQLIEHFYRQKRGAEKACCFLRSFSAVQKYSLVAEKPSCKPHSMQRLAPS